MASPTAHHLRLPVQAPGAEVVEVAVLAARPQVCPANPASLTVLGPTAWIATNLPAASQCQLFSPTPGPVRLLSSSLPAPIVPAAQAPSGQDSSSAQAAVLAQPGAAAPAPVATGEAQVIHVASSNPGNR